jgi:vacuolar iron transporter family protein
MARIQKAFGYYISDIIYGANDGIITTFAVVSGSAGAGLSAKVIIILGVASLVADGFSMGTSKYLSLTSEQDYHGLERDGVGVRNAKIDGSITFIAFVVAGLLPLAPFLVAVPGDLQFTVSACATALALFGVGSARSFVTKRNTFLSGLEMLLVGGVAAIIAYGAGALVESFLI